MNIRSWPWRVFLVVVLVAVVALVGSAVLLAQLPLEQMSITIDGERLDVHGLSGKHAAAMVGLGAVALISAAFLVAVVAVLGFVAVGLGIAIAAVATVASLLLTLSPLLFIGWVIWRASRSPPAAATPAPSGPTAATS